LHRSFAPAVAAAVAASVVVVVVVPPLCYGLVVSDVQ
jgi:hypothetical protein